jgi:hypothetical protein
MTKRIGRTEQTIFAKKKCDTCANGCVLRNLKESCKGWVKKEKKNDNVS